MNSYLQGHLNTIALNGGDILIFNAKLVKDRHGLRRFDGSRRALSWEDIRLILLCLLMRLSFLCFNSEIRFCSLKANMFKLSTLRIQYNRVGQYLVILIADFQGNFCFSVLSLKNGQLSTDFLFCNWRGLI